MSSQPLGRLANIYVSGGRFKVDLISAQVAGTYCHLKSMQQDGILTQYLRLVGLGIGRVSAFTYGAICLPKEQESTPNLYQHTKGYMQLITIKPVNEQGVRKQTSQKISQKEMKTSENGQITNPRKLTLATPNIPYRVHSIRCVRMHVRRWLNGSHSARQACRVSLQASIRELVRY